MERHNANGLAVAEFSGPTSTCQQSILSGTTRHHEYHDVAKRTMRGFGGLVTFLIDGRRLASTADIVDATRIPRIAPSLGGVESLIEQPLVMSYFEATPEERREWGIHDNMIRMSCGIEDTEDLIADLKQALEH